MNNIYTTVLADQPLRQRTDISYDYIRGLVDGEGCFTFYTGPKKSNGRKYKIPAFAIAMHERDKDLLCAVKSKLGLRNKIYIRKPFSKDGYNRGNMAVLVVREFDQLKNIIIPLFYKNLIGYKGKQFMAWIEKIGSYPDTSRRFKSLYNLYRLGMYDRHPNFRNKFKDM